MKKKGMKWSVSILLVLSMSFGLVSFNNDQRNFEIVKNLDIFYTLFRELNSYYVDETDPDKLIKTGIDAKIAAMPKPAESKPSIMPVVVANAVTITE